MFFIPDMACFYKPMHHQVTKLHIIATDTVNLNTYTSPINLSNDSQIYNLKIMTKLDVSRGIMSKSKNIHIGISTAESMEIYLDISIGVNAVKRLGLGIGTVINTGIGIYQ